MCFVKNTQSKGGEQYGKEKGSKETSQEKGSKEKEEVNSWTQKNK